MTARRRTGAIVVAGAGALTVAASTALVVPALPARDRSVGQPLLLILAAACLVTVARQASASRVANRRVPERTLEAIGGPCDGQQVTVRPGPGQAAELWLAQGESTHRYGLDRASDPLRYCYAPLDAAP